MNKVRDNDQTRGPYMSRYGCVISAGATSTWPGVLPTQPESLLALTTIRRSRKGNWHKSSSKPRFTRRNGENSDQRHRLFGIFPQKSLARLVYNLEQITLTPI